MTTRHSHSYITREQVAELLRTHAGYSAIGAAEYAYTVFPHGAIMDIVPGKTTLKPAACWQSPSWTLGKSRVPYRAAKR